MTAERGGNRIVRRPAVAGTFYPAEPGRLAALASELLATAPADSSASAPVGILVPHAGLVYSGAVAAAAWHLLAGSEATVVILGTNHSYPFTGIAAWDGAAWLTPVGEVPVDRDLAAGVAALGHAFLTDGPAHAREHSIEVQLPLLSVAAPGVKVVPLAVSAGVGAEAIAAGELLGRLLADRRAAGAAIALAISTDMAHYPPARRCAAITAELAPFIIGLDPGGLARAEAVVSGERGVACGMCGIEPTIVGLAALRAMGVSAGRMLAAATSADAGGDPARTVGYLSVVFA